MQLSSDRYRLAGADDLRLPHLLRRRADGSSGCLLLLLLRDQFTLTGRLYQANQHKNSEDDEGDIFQGPPSGLRQPFGHSGEFV